jgi:hypothetical protein
MNKDSGKLKFVRIGPDVFDLGPVSWPQKSVVRAESVRPSYGELREKKAPVVLNISLQEPYHFGFWLLFPDFPPLLSPLFSPY